LAILYCPRFTENPHLITARLISRAVQCWLLYALSVAILYITDPNYSLQFSVITVALLGVTPFTDILKFYTVALLFSPAILFIATRYGILRLTLGAIGVHVVCAVLRHFEVGVDQSLPREADRLTAFLFGLGDDTLVGPSVLHGLTFVVFGMALSRGLVSAKNGLLAVLFLGAVIVLACVALSPGPEAFTDDAMSLRKSNDPLYFLIGSASACALACLATLVTKHMPAKGWLALTFFGRTSLFTFAFGNMLLYMVEIEPRTREQSLFWTFSLTAAIGLLSFFFDRAVSQKGVVAHTVGTTRRFLDQLCTAGVRLASRE